MFFVYVDAHPRYRPVLTHSFPTRRSSDRRERGGDQPEPSDRPVLPGACDAHVQVFGDPQRFPCRDGADQPIGPAGAEEYVALRRSEEHTSELQSLMRIPYAVFCLKKKPNSAQSARALDQPHRTNLL